MALLHYENMGVHRPDILLNRTFFGLKSFYDFLNKTKSYMESDSAIQRLAWSPGVPPEREEEALQGVWVLLKEPDDRPNEPESTFKAFLEENLNELFDLPEEKAEAAANLRRKDRHSFAKASSIRILDRDPDNFQLLLERPPQGKQLLIRPNTLTLSRQITALQALQNQPSSFHLPLLRLMEATDHARWPGFNEAWIKEDDWMVLTDASREGTEEQRKFVEIAIETPDFAFLEGPPGSGKTTAICELILQLAKEGKRVLLCASTHVAVDNVLERLMDERNAHRDEVIPVRIGDKRNVSEKAQPWQLERFVKTERNRLLHHLQSAQQSESQQALFEAIQHGESMIERMVLDASNLVCGTTIGILQHPDIKARRPAIPTFDVLIVDEASKTTFHEFLVPALLAKRWVIVGDPKQLSPYVEDAAMAVNISACLPDESIRNACMDIFMAGQRNMRRRRVVVVATESARTRDAYLAQAAAHQVCVAQVGGSIPLWSADVVVGAQAELAASLNELPLDAATIRDTSNQLAQLRRRADAWLKLGDRRREEQPDWAGEISWRLGRLYEQRFASDELSFADGRSKSTREKLQADIDALLPVVETGANTSNVNLGIDRVRRVALPSVLESLRYGFERDPGARKGTALSDGLPEAALEARHVLLSTQHRMHPDIAHFSHQHIYDGEALFTPDDMKNKRGWGYSRHACNAVWRDVRGGFNPRLNANPKEAHAVIEELREFDQWSMQNPKADGQPWEAAVLTFYRGQEREVRTHMRRWAKQKHGMRRFTRGVKQRPHLTIELCTVDRFQGHEADLVIVSFASPRATSFLESPNRLNVALTRARYQRVIIGDRTGLMKAKGSLLGLLANSEIWERAIHD